MFAAFKSSRSTGVVAMRSSVVTGVLSAGLVAGSALAQDAVQWRIENGGNGHWYSKTTQIFDHFSFARSYTEANGGHLATLTSASENSFVASLAPGEAILGGYQDRSAADYVENAGGWRWVTGEPWKFTSWNPGEPNNGRWPDERGDHYLLWWRYANQYSSTWNDGGNDMTIPPWNGPWNLPAMIEWSADCNSDGIVDFGQIRAGELEDANTNNIPDCCEQGVACNCPADLDGNGNVDAVDLAVILSKWGTNGGKDYPQADVDGSGEIDGADLATVLSNWGPCL